MARANFTSIEFWMKLPLLEFAEWVQVAVDLGEKGAG